MFGFFRRALGPADPPDDEQLRNLRERMVLEQLVARGIDDARVLEAMRQVERHRFVPPALAAQAYADRPLSIGHGQTISQPFIVAFMTAALELTGNEKVLEVGTGSGYQTAVLARLARRVFTIEIVAALAADARRRLAGLGVEQRVGDGALGWPEEAPFDAIIVTAAPAELPRALLDQLTPDGRLVGPVGIVQQELCEWRRRGDGFALRKLLPVRFVPLR